MSSLLTLDPPMATSLSPVPSPDEKYQGLLGDYDSLLSLIRSTSHEKLANTLIKPTRCSPMYLEDETGQRSLQALAQHEDYRALCKTVGASPYNLTVTLKDGKAVCETRSSNSEVTLPIPLGKHPVWDGWLANIEKAVRKLGGQIRQNGEVTFARMAWFYGIPLADPLDDKQREAAILALEEKRARHSLGLGNAIRLDELGHGSAVKNKSVDDLIMETMGEHLPQLRTSLLAHLSPIDIASLTIEELRAKPSFYLEKILLSEKAEALTEALLRALEWYGGHHGEDSAPSVRIKLLVKAIDLWLLAGKNEPEGAIAGYQWQAPSNWGKSYEAIWLAFESYLRTSERASSVNESVLLACLYRSSFPLELQIPDIPAELPYRSSTVWVNFVHGVQLANAIDPTLLLRLSVQQLMDLPNEYIDEGNAEDLKLASITRLQPALDWAVTNGFVPERTDADYSVQTIEKAMQKLDEAIAHLSRAVTDLDKRPPDRLKIATLELTKLFGHSRFLTGWKMEREASAFSTGSGTWKTGPSFHSQYSLVDVYASGELSKAKWFINPPQTAWLTLSEEGIVDTNLFGRQLKGKTLPNIENLFDTQLKNYIKLISSAYQQLIIHQIASLPLIDRRALEYGTIKLYSLRQPTGDMGGVIGVEEETLPLRARCGFILEATYDGKVTYYELVPRAGVIRPRPDIAPHHIGATTTFGPQMNPAEQIAPGIFWSFQDKNKHLPFDWNAHINGTVPEKNMQCQAIMDQIGGTLGKLMNSDPPDISPATLESSSIQSIANHIADRLLFIDEAELRRACYGQTEFDRQQANLDKLISVIKSFIPFWESIENLSSGQRKKINEGLLGLTLDLAAFVFPFGKFASGSMKIIRVGGKLTFTKKLPLLAKNVGVLFNSTLNPLDGIPSLLKAGGLSLFRLSKKGYLSLKTLSGRAGQYDLLKGVPQATDPGRWRPLSTKDRLATVYEIEDAPVRNIASHGKSDFRLVDPLSTKPYGPALTTEHSGLSLGPSRYDLLGKTESDSLFKIPGNTQVKEVLEVDGSRTFYLDDVPYRLEDGALRRVDTLDATKKFKKLPCRLRRSPDETCKVSYVLKGEPAERPVGIFNTQKGWAPWFGDVVAQPSIPTTEQRALVNFEGKIYELKEGNLSTYKGSPRHIGLESKAPVPRNVVSATMEFQTGIYGGIKITGTAEHIDDVHHVGAIIVPSIDNNSQYIFTCVNTDIYYSIKIPIGSDIKQSLKLRKLDKAELNEGYGEELKRIYDGSLNANNMARVHGIEKVEQALKNMDEVSIPIGVTPAPPKNMKCIKVDTSPAEALLFDHRTRMMVVELPNGTALWKPATSAPRQATNMTTSVFGALFKKESLPINEAMTALQNILPRYKKNIAFAHLVLASGKTEVYVSVSGVNDFTRHLPLFNSNPRQVEVNGTNYFNMDEIAGPVVPTSLSIGPDNRVLSIPHSSRSDIQHQVTSADSESKLVGFIREKYPNNADIRSMTIATTLPPCDSCAIVMKEFGHSRGADSLNVTWGKRPNLES
ncbi:deaminase domain-containing protein [Pseudomonas sp. Z4-20]|uniref:deaminase domain-containing protein n=1 Tax=Pseudomonas sp. Z4-20 TaxID=2817414 RepID=UPI003DAA0463